MPDTTIQERRDLVRPLTDEVLLASQRLLGGSTSVNFEQDHLGFMILSYASMQDERLRSVRLLVDGNRDQDAAFVARSMAEGAVLLVWSAKEPITRPILWRGYAYVADWRTARIRQSLGMPPNEEHERHVQRYLANHGMDYYSRTANRVLNKGKNLPDDPYRHQWYNQDIASMFREVGWQPVYDQFYRRSSDWGHWNIQPLAKSISLGNERLVFRPTDPTSAVAALTVGFESLLSTLKILDRHFELGKSDDLFRLGDPVRTLNPTLLLDL